MNSLRVHIGVIFIHSGVRHISFQSLCRVPRDDIYNMFLWRLYLVGGLVHRCGHLGLLLLAGLLFNVFQPTGILFRDLTCISQILLIVPVKPRLPKLSPVMHSVLPFALDHVSNRGNVIHAIHISKRVYAPCGAKWFISWLFWRSAEEPSMRHTLPASA